MQAESDGDVRAVSPAGAMGLMQIMPKTWAELRMRHRLGDDPYDPRDNILAGAAYLAELHARFGSPGFLAAYNAGPARYAEHLSTGRQLPSETRAYVANLAPRIGAGAVPPSDTKRRPNKIAWTRAPLFVVPPSGSGSDAQELSGRLQPPAAGEGSASAPNGTGLFAVRTEQRGQHDQD